jgi:succinyl-CoA synthetase beta subunit
MAPVMVVSPQGGTSIEQVAASNPEVIFTEPIDLTMGIQRDMCIRMANNLGLEEGTAPHERAITLMTNLYNMFVKCDCTRIENQSPGRNHGG